MREKHFPEFAEDRLVAVINSKSYISQGQSHKFRAEFVRRHKRYETWFQFCNRVTCFLCKSVAVSGRTRFRVRSSAACDKNGVGTVLLTACSDSHTSSVLYNKRRNSLIYHAHTEFFHLTFKCVRNVVRTVAHWKDTVAALCFERNSEFLEKAHNIAAVTGGKCAVHKPRIHGDIFHVLLCGTVISDVTAPLSCYAEFPAEPLVLLKEHNALAEPSRVNRRKTACCSVKLM